MTMAGCQGGVCIWWQVGQGVPVVRPEGLGGGVQRCLALVSDPGATTMCCGALVVNKQKGCMLDKEGPCWLWLSRASDVRCGGGLLLFFSLNFPPCLQGVGWAGYARATSIVRGVWGVLGRGMEVLDAIQRSHRHPGRQPRAVCSLLKRLGLRYPWKPGLRGTRAPVKLY